MYTDNPNCDGPCIRSDWRNDGTDDCSDGSDEEIFDYDYEDNDNDAYDYEDDNDFKAIHHAEIQRKQMKKIAGAYKKCFWHLQAMLN